MDPKLKRQVAIETTSARIEEVCYMLESLERRQLVSLKRSPPTLAEIMSVIHLIDAEEENVK